MIPRGTQVTNGLCFWPAWVGPYHNANVCPGVRETSRIMVILMVRPMQQLDVVGFFKTLFNMFIHVLTVFIFVDSNTSLKLSGCAELKAKTENCYLYLPVIFESQMVHDGLVCLHLWQLCCTVTVVVHHVVILRDELKFYWDMKTASSSGNPCKKTSTWHLRFTILLVEIVTLSWLQIRNANVCVLVAGSAILFVVLFVSCRRLFSAFNLVLTLYHQASQEQSSG